MKKPIIIASGLGSYLAYHTLTTQHQKDVQGAFNGFFNSFSAIRVGNKNSSKLFLFYLPVAQSAYEYQYELSKYDYNSEEYHAQRSIIHQKVANRILQLSLNNRGVYLKAGQYIGNLERVMPKEFTQTLRVLQDQGPQVIFDEIKVVIEHDLNKKVSDIFTTFEEKAIAAASLAQVHRAKLRRNDKIVAVKIQFPQLRIQYRYDLLVIGKIAQFSDWMLNWNGKYDLHFAEIFDTFRIALEKELDFRIEAQNGERTKQQFKNYQQLYIPEYYDVSERMLVMEFVEGVKINDVEGIKAMGLKTLDCANILVSVFGQMIFKYGHVHCDAHPGNIMIRKGKNNKPQLILLDHGFYTDIESARLQQFCRLWLAMAQFDKKGTELHAKELGIIGEEHLEFLPLIFFYRTMESKKRLGETMSQEERQYLRSKDIVNLTNISKLMRVMPNELLFIIRAANLVGIHNALLGGTTRFRLKQFTFYAIQQLYSGLRMYYWICLLRIKLFFFENAFRVFNVLYN